MGSDLRAGSSNGPAFSAAKTPLLLSGLATCASWLCYFKALSPKVNKVVGRSSGIILAFSPGFSFRETTHLPMKLFIYRGRRRIFLMIEKEKSGIVKKRDGVGSLRSFRPFSRQRPAGKDRSRRSRLESRDGGENDCDFCRGLGNRWRERKTPTTENGPAQRDSFSSPFGGLDRNIVALLLFRNKKRIGQCRDSDRPAQCTRNRPLFSDCFSGTTDPQRRFRACAPYCGDRRDDPDRMTRPSGSPGCHRHGNKRRRCDRTRRTVNARQGHSSVRWIGSVFGSLPVLMPGPLSVLRPPPTGST